MACKFAFQRLPVGPIDVSPMNMDSADQPCCCRQSLPAHIRIMTGYGMFCRRAMAGAAEYRGPSSSASLTEARASLTEARASDTNRAAIVTAARKPVSRHFYVFLSCWTPQADQMAANTRPRRIQPIVIRNRPKRLHLREVSLSAPGAGGAITRGWRRPWHSAMPRRRNGNARCKAWRCDIPPFADSAHRSEYQR